MPLNLILIWGCGHFLGLVMQPYQGFVGTPASFLATSVTKTFDHSILCANYAISYFKYVLAAAFAVEAINNNSGTFLSLLIFKIHCHYPGHNQIPTFCPIHRLNLNILKQTFPHTSTIFSFFQHCQIAV